MAPSHRPAPSRSKSCAACTKSKRRCDFALPACLRCSDRGLECQYPQRTRSNILRMNPPSASTLPPAPPTPTAQTALTAPTPVSVSAPASVESSSTTPESFIAGILMDEILAGDSFSQEPFHLKDFDGSALESEFQWDSSGRGEPVAGVGMRDRSPPMRGPGLQGRHFVEEATFAGPSVEQINEIRLTTFRNQEPMPIGMADGMREGSKYLQKIPREIVETLGTPWCHKEVFKSNMPKALEEAIASCALYVTKTEETSGFVMRTIINNISKLSKSPGPPTHRQTLARAQALGIYHILALFDGDIECRAVASSLVPEMEEASESLLAYVTSPNSPSTLSANPPRDLPLFPLAETESFWRSWILHESTRRTWLFTNQLLVMYSFLTKRPGRMAACTTPEDLSWSLSGHLWRAANALDFSVAWGGRRQLVITMGRFAECLNQAQAEDLDDFGRMLLTCFMGEQQARGWMASRGGSL
ncbi:uncharacterized protein DNG_09510 [Cephalotrichum gorgonifer]|uniref:Zn(2)-C6 fungal-type domain-containing protein n=1 Tax=Cephalotrichum gorgonifer TaxID=2041049 RepID=A0AAE8N5V3_9PEZI|nr:uncharacterized protein DNG_09510 [Cephalotrichum gorgonifer]